MEFLDGPIQNGMQEIGCDLDERVENEGTLMHSGMWQLEIAGRHDGSIDQKEIEIERPRAVAHRIGSFTAVFTLDLMKSIEQ